MRLTPLLLVSLTTLLTTSCHLFKPKEPAASTYDPYGQSNPYGQAGASNPYGTVPGANPYGQAPGAAANPYGSYEQPQTYTSPSTSPYSPVPSTGGGGGGGGGGGTVTVKAGDTLTSIARRNNTTVSALRSANGLSGDLIKIGQTLHLP